MSFTALSPNFLVKVPKEEENNRREMDGGLFLHPNYIYMTRNTQCGIIESISENAHKEFPEAVIGDMLLIHHFVQRSHSTKGDNDKFIAFEDETYKYYNVTSKESNGNNNMSYGIYRNGVIIPHPQYVFLEKEIDNKDGWYQTSEQVYQKLEAIKNSIEYLAKTKKTPDTIMAMRNKEAEMSILNQSLHTKEYLPYKISFAHPSLGISNGTTIFALSIAVNTIVEVQGIEYRIAEAKYIAAI